jgi:hypothetical protein
MRVEDVEKFEDIKIGDPVVALAILNGKVIGSINAIVENIRPSANPDLPKNRRVIYQVLLPNGKSLACYPWEVFLSVEQNVI